MAKLTKRIVDAATARSSDYFIWDDDLAGFGLRVFTSGKRSYLIQYRAAGRTRRYTIGLHGTWTPETARREARILLGRIAQGQNPAEERRIDARAITVKELCAQYVRDAENGLGCASLPTASGPGASAKTTIVCLEKFSMRLLTMISSNRPCRSSDYWR